MSPGRAELSLFKGKLAFFVFVFMSGAARPNEGTAIMPKSVSTKASAWKDGRRPVPRLNDTESGEGLSSIFKGSWISGLGTCWM